MRQLERIFAAAQSDCGQPPRRILNGRMACSVDNIDSGQSLGADLPYGCRPGGIARQMRVVHRGSSQTATATAAPAVGEVDPARISTMRLGRRAPQAIRIRRNQDQVNVIGHQAPGQAMHVALAAGCRHQFDICGIILVLEEYRLPPVARWVT
ncbi:hypothetical protein PIB19_19555 [Sphingomonas sp. 7/4-4]|nr:hypothetical protein [Sphingomonas sp. 7/4-4]WBY07512.1 hypothetical protein PIB19_19555 [Sphingomonas sp. 7/4-4]